MATVQGNGLALVLPDGWEASIYKRPTVEGPSLRSVDGAEAPDGGVTYPMMHAANFALPPSRGDYGSGAVEKMGTNDVFVSLHEFGPESLGKRLFAHEGIPRFNARDMHPQGLQRALPGQSGAQLWFTEAGRAFGLYAVMGAHTNRVRLVREVNAALDNLRIDAA